MAELASLRSMIDRLDEELLSVLSRRLRTCEEVALIKKRDRLAVMQPGRVTQVKENNVRHGQELGLDAKFVESLYDLIIEEACRLEDHVVVPGTG